MLYLVRFQEIATLLVDAESPQGVVARLAELGEIPRPTLIREVPAGVFVAEVEWCTGADESAPDNAADLSGHGVVLEPFLPLVEWLEGADPEDAAEAAAEAETLPAPPEADEAGA